MPIRITGMNSGLDTESIISELVKAQKTKVDAVKKKQTIAGWKQDAWKELNTKIYKLFQNTLGSMRFSTDYSKKITDVSDSSIASVISSDDAMNATQKLQVVSLANSGYMTGAEISKSGGGDVTKDTKLTDLGIKAGSTITVSTGDKTTDIRITENTTMQSLVGELKNAGVEANFDEKNKRLHIAAAKSGAKNDFVITASDADGTDALNKLGILSYDAKAMEAYKKYAGMTAVQIQEAVDKDVANRLQSYISQRESLLKTQETQTKALADSKDAFEKKYLDAGETSIEDALANKEALKQNIDKLKEELKDTSSSLTEEEKKAKQEELKKLEGKMSALENYENQKKALDATKQSVSDVESYLSIDKTDLDNVVITAGTKLTDEVKRAWDNKVLEAQKIVNASSKPTGNFANRTEGKDAQIVLNGVTYTGDSNTFEVNGLTITALQESSKEITLTTRQDTEGVYNKIKSFLKEYNALINEMDKLYNAESTKEYEPLTDEEKKELSDSEVEKWEDKIKGSILRRDSNLSTISNAMKTIMLQGVTVNGKQMYLSDFGIETLGYFGAAENERNAYHINGDEDDASVASKTNDLKAAIAADPDAVIGFFSQLSQNLYSELSKQSSSVEGVRSFGSFYDDKRMEDDYNSYKTKIKQQEDKLTALEEKWYNKFAAMETALAKLQSNQSAVSSLLGGM